MKKTTKTAVALGGVALASCMMFAGCGGPEKLWGSDFADGNQGIFKSYQESTITDNSDGTITLGNVEVEGYKTSANTYFGETDKNYEWKEGGLNVAFKIKVDKDVLTDGQYNVWSLALNETDGTYLTELPVFFVGTENGVKFVYDFAGVDSYATIINNEDAVTLTNNGFYTVQYAFKTDKDGVIKVTVTLNDNNGKEVYKSADKTFTVIEPELHEGKNYTNETIVKESMVKGLRYLWNVRASTNVIVDSIEITK